MGPPVVLSEIEPRDVDAPRRGLPDPAFESYEPQTRSGRTFAPSDIAFLDTEQLSGRYASRSAAVQDAVRLLRESRLADAYAQAFGEGYDEEWDTAVDDGLASA